MKILLAAINAKYIHSNLAVYSLKSYVDSKRKNHNELRTEIDIGEYTINQPIDGILQDIYKRKPDMIGFSCYIWNIQFVLQIARNLIKVLPKTAIWLGGPEVSYDGRQVLKKEAEITGIMVGEGEETFSELIDYYEQLEFGHVPKKDLAQILGIIFRCESGSIIETAQRPPLCMDTIPFPYQSLERMEHRIVYYESSRGCPYSCSYCLSSIDKRVRFRSLELVKQELDFFLKWKVPQVKFIDRTFNCKKSHCIEIWKYLLKKDNGVTNFHFEISGDLLSDEELELLEHMRPGQIQLEIGVQTINPKTIEEIHRNMDLVRLEQNVRKIKTFGNIHQHLDLIVGLPYEDFESFCQSFDRVYHMRPEQLQLGFLKVLKGSHMEEMAETYGLSYHEEPPYEVLFTKWLDYEEVLRLKRVEEIVEVYYNSNQFSYTLREMENKWQSPYAMFESMANYYRKQGFFEINHSRLARYEILFQFLQEQEPQRIEIYRDILMYDLYLRENVKSRPQFAREQGGYKTRIKQFFIEESQNPRYLKGYEAYDSRQISKMAHVEVMADGKMILFDYQNRSPLNYNARTEIVG